MARPKNNLPAVAHDGAARCLLAIEMSKQSWVIAAITPLSDKISRHTLKSRNGLLELVGRLRAQIGRVTSQMVEVISYYEAGYDGFFSLVCVLMGSRRVVLIRLVQPRLHMGNEGAAG